MVGRKHVKVGSKGEEAVQDRTAGVVDDMVTVSIGYVRVEVP